MYRLITILSLITLTILLVSLGAYAQPFPPDPVSEGAPIDGFVSLLVLASVGFGAYRLREKQ